MKKRTSKEKKEMSKEKKKFWILIHTASWVVLDLPEA